MTSHLENISFVSKKYLRKMSKITDPLRDKFGITYFARQAVSNTGEWEILGNLPDWLDHSASKEFFKIDPSLLHPGHYQSGLVVISSHTTPDFLKNMTLECRNVYNLDHCLCIFQKTISGGEWYFFAASSLNPNIVNTYITQIQEIYRFIHYFKQEAKILLNKNLDYKIDLAHLKNEPFHANKNYIELASFEFEEDDPFIMHDNITSRERQCLIYLFQGKTCKETAQILGLSYRTVEEYIKRVKQKTGCRYKRELISYFKTERAR